MTVEEYQVAQLWSVAEASKAETGGGEGIEVLKNEPYDDKFLLEGQSTSGQFTHKIYHLASKVPSFIRLLAPKGALEVHEEAWNAYPYCRTVISNPEYMKENFFVKIESLHLPDRGDTENAHQLPPDILAQREIVELDIATYEFDPKDYKPDIDPKLFHSVKSGRGPLKPGWQSTANPVMTCYKLVTIEFKWWGLQNRVETVIHKQYPRLFTKFHREVFCWMDNWYGLTMEDIRALEDKTKDDLDKALKEGEVRGMTAE
jgi:hypothetical protein